MAENGKQAVAVQEQQPPTLLERMERDFVEMRRRMADFFRWPFPPPYGPTLLREAAWEPRADAYEAEGALVVKADLPGVKKDDIAITVRDRVLTIEGKREEQKEVKQERYYAAERFSGSFMRSFALPEGVDTNAITAEYKDGVLEVRVPLPAQAKTEPAKIEIKS